MGLNNLEGCLIAEELSYGCSGIGTALEANGLGVCTFCYNFTYHITLTLLLQIASSCDSSWQQGTKNKVSWKND